MRTLVIGYGNPLRADDGVGWIIAQQFAQDLHDEAVQVLSCHQLTPDLAEPLSRVSRVIFVDANSRGTPGQIDCQVISPAPVDAPASTHHLTPAALLAYAHYLYQCVPATAIVVSVSGATFDVGDVLSPAVTAALPELAAMIQDLLA